MEDVISINFGNIINEMRNKRVKLCFIENAIYLEDLQENLYVIDLFYVGSHLQRFIENKTIIKFTKINQENFNIIKIGTWDISKVKNFIKTIGMNEKQENYILLNDAYSSCLCNEAYFSNKTRSYTKEISEIKIYSKSEMEEKISKCGLIPINIQSLNLTPDDFLYNENLSVKINYNEKMLKLVSEFKFKRCQNV